MEKQAGCAQRRDLVVCRRLHRGWLLRAVGQGHRLGPGRPGSAPALPPWRGVTGCVLKPVCTSGSPPRGGDGPPEARPHRCFGPGLVRGSSLGRGLAAGGCGRPLRAACHVTIYFLRARARHRPLRWDVGVVSSGVSGSIEEDRTLTAAVCREPACRGVARRQPEGAGPGHRGAARATCEVASLGGTEGTRGHGATGPAWSGAFMPQAGPAW